MPERAIRLRQTLHLKVKGTDTALPVAFGDLGAMRAAFAAAHRARFGFDPGEAALVIEAVEVEAVGEAADLTEPEVGGGDARRGRAGAALVAPVFLGGEWVETRASCGARRCAPGDRLSGPAVLVEPHTSILVEPGWRARITGARPCADARGSSRGRSARRSGREADPVLLEVFNNLYMSIAEQMGAVLENTAASVTIKERLDFSCAVFDAAGI